MHWIRRCRLSSPVRFKKHSQGWTDGIAYAETDAATCEHVTTYKYRWSAETNEVQPETVSSKQMEYRQKQKYYYGRGAKGRTQGQLSDTRSLYLSPKAWKPAQFVSKSEAPRLYLVDAGSGRPYRRSNNMLMFEMFDYHLSNFNYHTLYWFHINVIIWHVLSEYDTENISSPRFWNIFSFEKIVFYLLNILGKYLR